MTEFMKFNPFIGNYIFHVHTNFTDGKLTVKDYFEYANQTGIVKIIFLEHIRKSPSYSVKDFIDKVYECSSEFKISANIGFEAKLLPSGVLDISDEHLAMAEVIGITEHGFPDNLDLYKQAILKAIDRYSLLLKNKAVVWVHPGLWLRKRGLLKEENTFYLNMIRYASVKELFVEYNFKHKLIPKRFIGEVSQKNIVYGIDAHRLGDLILKGDLG